MATLPRPIFSPKNPYWRKPVIAGVFPDYQPRPNGQDYAYATTWELTRPFLQPALCLLIRRLRQPIWLYVMYMGFRKFWREEVIRLRASKEVPFSKETIECESSNQ